MPFIYFALCMMYFFDIDRPLVSGVLFFLMFLNICALNSDVLNLGKKDD